MVKRNDSMILHSRRNINPTRTNTLPFSVLGKGEPLFNPHPHRLSSRTGIDSNQLPMTANQNPAESAFPTGVRFATIVLPIRNRCR
jgi:hypothetical protein